MARPLSLTAYRALSRRSPAERFTPPAPRPDGKVVWMHATSPGRLAAMQDVAHRLKVQNSDLSALITLNGAADDPLASAGRGADWVFPFGSDTRGYIRAFLDHWRPALCLWTGGHLLPNTIGMTRERNIPLLLADADEVGIQSGSGSWIPTLSRATLLTFDRILASSTEAAQRLIRKGVPAERIEVTPPLQVSGNPPPVSEDAVDELTHMLGGRLPWLAAHVQLDEVDTVLSAHLNTARLAHRLLLVLVPARGIDPATLRATFERRSVRWIDWDAGESPDDYTQVILAEAGAEIGQWYRVAPVSFLGSSLHPGVGGASPFDAAALGSAVLYGPNIRQHMAAYTRLATAGAARIVKDAEGLSAGVLQLIAPDHAAAMALAAWEVVSEGAQITDRLLDLIEDRLDQQEVT